MLRENPVRSSTQYHFCCTAQRAEGTIPPPSSPAQRLAHEPPAQWRSREVSKILPAGSMRWLEVLALLVVLFL